MLQTLQRRARGERWVLKAPSHLAQLRTLFAVYPDARVIQIHRDPLKSVPSTISLMGTLKSMRSGQVDVDSLAPLVSMGYGLMLDDTIDARDRGELPDDQFVDVLYGDLHARRRSTPCGGVYGALGLAWPAAARRPRWPTTSPPGPRAPEGPTSTRSRPSASTRRPSGSGSAATSSTSRSPTRPDAGVR